MKIRQLSLGLLVLLCSGIFSVQAEEAAVEYEFVDSSRSIMRSGPGQTLLMLVQQIYPRYEHLWPRLEQEIRNRNPHAFNSYTGNIIPGERLKLVTIKVIRKSRLLTLTVVGNVNAIQGQAMAINKIGTERELSESSELYEGDRLTTAKASMLSISMIDGAKMLLKPDSTLRLTEYTLKTGFETGSRSILDLIKGGLRKITGSIGANPLSVYRFHTGVVTIGVRGTDYVIKLCSENDCKRTAGRNDGDVRLHVAVLDGLVSMEDEEGAIGELIMGQYAIATREAKVIVNEGAPVQGLLDIEEQEIFKQVTSSPKSDSKSIWPWILGGALFGL